MDSLGSSVFFWVECVDTTLHFWHNNYNSFDTIVFSTAIALVIHTTEFLESYYSVVSLCCFGHFRTTQFSRWSIFVLRSSVLCLLSGANSFNHLSHDHTAHKLNSKRNYRHGCHIVATIRDSLALALYIRLKRFTPIGYKNRWHKRKP